MVRMMTLAATTKGLAQIYLHILDVQCEVGKNEKLGVVSALCSNQSAALRQRQPAASHTNCLPDS